MHCGFTGLPSLVPPSGCPLNSSSPLVSTRHIVLSANSLQYPSSPSNNAVFASASFQSPLMHLHELEPLIRGGAPPSWDLVTSLGIDVSKPVFIALPD